MLCKVDLTDKATIQAILKKSSLSPKKRLGQHFLISQDALGKILDAASLSEKDTVLEIGPGLGTLTLALARRAGRVIAIEKDREIIGPLRKVLAEENVGNVEVVEGDILKISKSQTPISNTILPDKVVADIPYYLTSHLLRTIFESRDGFFRNIQSAVLLVQKEVAERICAGPGAMSLLAVSVQYFAEPRIADTVPRTSFWPQPAVDSAILTLHVRPRLESDTAQETFFQVVRAGFSHPRKLLASNLRVKNIVLGDSIPRTFRECGIGVHARAQDLGLEQWKCLSNALPEANRVVR